MNVGGRGVALFNVDGEYFALRDVCPHQGARLSDGTVLGWVAPSAPGCYAYEPGRKLVRCPWHGWEYEAGLRATACRLTVQATASARTR